jgi:dTDP-6-deoxy-L-talose 4-dehydrogenase (NAD+)
MYGNGQSQSSLYPQLMAAVGAGDRVFRMSHGEQLRDYLPVEAVAAYLVDLALQPHSGGVVNVCSGRPISVRRLVEEWLKEVLHKPTLELGYYAVPDYEPIAFWGSNRKLLGMLSK